MNKLPNGQIEGKATGRGKGRLQREFLDRIEGFCDRCVAVAEQVKADGHFGRIAEQLAASGASVGANLAEADEAMSSRDFRKCVAIASKELAETRFWLRLIVRRGWVSETRLEPLLSELGEIKLIVGTIFSRTALLTTTKRTGTRD